MDPPRATHQISFKEFKEYLSNPINNGIAEKLLNCFEDRCRGEYNDFNLTFLRSDRENEKIIELFCSVQYSIKQIPFPCGWRTKDQLLIEKISRVKGEIESIYLKIQIWITSVQRDLKAFETLPTVPGHYLSNLELLKSNYEKEGVRIVNADYEGKKCINEIADRIKPSARSTTLTSYLLFVEAHDVSLKYAQQNREDYQNNTQIFAIEKNQLDSALKLMCDANELYKKLVYALGQKEKKEFVLTLPTRSISIGSPMQALKSLKFKNLSADDYEKVFNIFMRLVEAQKRQENVHQINIECLPRDRIGYLLRVAQDWTPCFNDEKSEEINSIIDGKNELQDMLVLLKQQFQLFEVSLELYEQFINKYNFLFEKINHSLQVVAQKKNISDESCKLFALCHDLSEKQVKYNIEKFVGNKNYLVCKEELKLLIEKFYQPTLLYLASAEVNIFQERIDVVHGHFGIVKKIFEERIEILHAAFHAIDQERNDPTPLETMYKDKSADLECIAKLYNVLIDEMNQRLSAIKTNKVTPDICPLILDSTGKLIKENIANKIDPKPLEIEIVKLKEEHQELRTTIETFGALLTKYKAITGAVPNSWNEWLLKTQYWFWYSEAPPTEPDTENTIWPTSAVSGIYDGIDLVAGWIFGSKVSDQ